MKLSGFTPAEDLSLDFLLIPERPTGSLPNGQKELHKKLQSSVQRTHLSLLNLSSTRRFLSICSRSNQTANTMFLIGSLRLGPGLPI
ncbi:hypothetical protein Y1Q_0001464 [Alligator mississippiensis]|uniref:Uncharacterized protein n=1 Tax=Alligator mississippiensis TaxID=8496 RepID=A0A151M9L5_ALLMI|nr:hypothetical protein Y1Q_0001464 [Alligator mississippiensis]